AGAHRTAEEHGLGLAIAVVVVSPVLLHAVDHGDDAAVLALVGVLAGLTRARQIGVVARGLPGAEVDGVGAAAPACEQREQQHDHADDAATAAEGHPHAASRATSIGDLRGVEPSVFAKSHTNLH